MATRKHMTYWHYSKCFWWGSCCTFFQSLCCPIMCLYLPSSMLWCPLRFSHNNMFSSSLPPVVCRRAHVLFMLIVFVSYSCVLHILCCVFVLFVFVLCTRFSGLSIFDCLWYSLTFIHHAMKNHHSNIVKHLFVVDIELFSWNQ